jgi:hypothetical protein
MMNEKGFLEWMEHFIETAFDSSNTGEPDAIKPGGRNYQIGLRPIWIPARSCRASRSA